MASNGLRHVSDADPGIRRLRSRGGFRYVDPRGRAVRDPGTLARIRALAIPPAWTDVWICAEGCGHLQATGRDARGRKQYRYHPGFRALREESKYERLADFAVALRAIRRRTQRDLARPGLQREKVLAALVRLLERTRARIGNEEYARQNGSFGLTTLRNRHVKVNGQHVTFRFRGKSGREHVIGLEDPRLAAVVRRCRDLPGQELFAYMDSDGAVQRVGSADVNDYLREATGRDFTAKDFRTWAGTVLAARALARRPAADSVAAARRNVTAAIETVARALGNTTAVCRKAYVHPRVVDAYAEGRIGPVSSEADVLRLLRRRASPGRRRRSVRSGRSRGR